MLKQQPWKGATWCALAKPLTLLWHKGLVEFLGAGYERACCTVSTSCRILLPRRVHEGHYCYKKYHECSIYLFINHSHCASVSKISASLERSHGGKSMNSAHCKHRHMLVLLPAAPQALLRAATEGLKGKENCTRRVAFLSRQDLQVQRQLYLGLYDISLFSVIYFFFFFLHRP